jgi:alpha-L-fucosidase
LEGQSGHRDAKQWLPAECDVSIRPGWFWHESENDKVKTPQTLIDLYYRSVGHGCNLLLNVPPDRRGQIFETDAANLKRFGDLLHETFKTNLAAGANVTLIASNVRGGDAAYSPRQLIDHERKDRSDRYSYWSTDDEVKTPELVIDFGADTTFSVVRLRENIKLGQRVEAFAIDAWKNNAWQEVASGTSIGPSRLVRLDTPQTTSKVRLRITKSPVAPALSDLGIFAEPSEARPVRE